MPDTLTTSTVRTAAGPVRGRRAGGVDAFLGIPYAAPPFGTHRFRAPQPVMPWTEVRDVTAYGPTAPKGPYPEYVRPLLPEITVPGEECLNLNVWTPDPGASLPVLVWIHGGSFTQGSGANAEYDGTAFARDGVVCVTINYRLGAEGFLALEGADSNRGLRDMIAALEWVHENIAAFGGDPTRVTLAGESAGAMAIAPLMVVPAAAGLFARAVLQSGAAAHVLSGAQADLVAGSLADRLGLPPTREAFTSVDPGRLVDAVTALALEVRSPGAAAEWGAIAGMLPFAPAVDGDLLPRHPLKAVAAGPAQVPALIGTTRDEARLYLVPNGAIGAVDDATVAAFASGNGITDLSPFVGTTPGATLVALSTYARYERPAAELVAARGSTPTWTYRFDGLEPHDNGGLGSCHASELSFVFGTSGLPQFAPLVGAHPSPAVAETMHSTWVRFVTTGDPGWPAGTTARLAHLVSVQ